MTRLDRIYENLDEEIFKLVDRNKDVIRQVLDYLNEEDDTTEQNIPG